MEAALYGPDGFYEREGGGAGRRADFLTAPEVGPLFGAVLARALDAWSDGAENHQPDEGESRDQTIARHELARCGPWFAGK